MSGPLTGDEPRCVAISAGRIVAANGRVIDGTQRDYGDRVAELPEERAERARCRSVSGEIQSGFANLRSALPMNLKASHPGFPVWAGARADLDRIETIWSECLDRSGGPYLFGGTFTLADAMFAPVCTRIRTYDVKVGAAADEYTETILSLPEMVEWTHEALQEPDDVEELEMEF